MSQRLIKPLLIIGYSWLTIVGIYIVLQYIRVLLTEGLPLAQRFLSILNLWNIVFILIALMPGLMCILLAGHFRKTQTDKSI